MSTRPRPFWRREEDPERTHDDSELVGGEQSEGMSPSASQENPDVVKAVHAASPSAVAVFAQWYQRDPEFAREADFVWLAYEVDQLEEAGVALIELLISQISGYLDHAESEETSRKLQRDQEVLYMALDRRESRLSERVTPRTQSEYRRMLLGPSATALFVLGLLMTMYAVPFGPPLTVASLLALLHLAVEYMSERWSS